MIALCLQIFIVVQLHGISEDYLYESVAKELLDEAQFEIIPRDDKSSISVTCGYIRAYVKIRLHSPLPPPLTHKQSEKGCLIYARIVYEKIRIFCFHCGMVGHLSRCVFYKGRSRPEEEEEGTVQEKTHLCGRPWLREQWTRKKCSRLPRFRLCAHQNIHCQKEGRIILLVSLPHLPLLISLTLLDPIHLHAPFSSPTLKLTFLWPVSYSGFLRWLKGDGSEM